MQNLTFNFLLCQIRPNSTFSFFFILALTFLDFMVQYVNSVKVTNIFSKVLLKLLIQQYFS